MSRLDELEGKWAACSSFEKCPPVIGLAPLSDADSEEISQLIGAATPGWSAQARFGALVRLVELQPAMLAMWLARGTADTARGPW